MKLKILHIIFFAFFISNLSFSQTSVGVTGGVNFSQFSGEFPKFTSKNLRYGIIGGIILDVNILANSFIAVEFLYSQQGNRYRLEYNNYGIKYVYEVKNKLDYILVPLNWKQDFGDIYTRVGVYGAIPFRAQSKWTNSRELTDTIVSNSGIYRSFNENLRSYDFGAYMGFGFKREINRNSIFFINLSFRIGFMSIFEANLVEEKYNNQIFSVQTGIIFKEKNSRNETFRNH